MDGVSIHHMIKKIFLHEIKYILILYIKKTRILSLKYKDI